MLKALRYPVYEGFAWDHPLRVLWRKTRGWDPGVSTRQFKMVGVGVVALMLFLLGGPFYSKLALEHQLPALLIGPGWALLLGLCLLFLLATCYFGAMPLGNETGYGYGTFSYAMSRAAEVLDLQLSELAACRETDKLRRRADDALLRLANKLVQVQNEHPDCPLLPDRREAEREFKDAYEALVEANIIPNAGYDRYFAKVH